MGCAGCVSPITIEIRYHHRKNWPEQWIREAAPGDLLLLEGGEGKSGGVLRLPPPGVFVVLSPEQVWHRKAVIWPFSNSDVKRFRIVGSRIECFRE